MILRTCVMLIGLAGVLASPVAANDERIAEATRVLESMGIKPGVVKSVHYHILFAGERDFAEHRRKILELTYRNVTVFVRNKMKIKVNTKHDRLLVILLDTQDQMMEFSRRSVGLTLSRGVAGYYSPDKNWSVFFNQTRSRDIEELRDLLNSWESQLRAMEGGSATRVVINSPTGPKTVTKAQLRRDMRQLYQEVMSETKNFNTVVTQHEGAHHIAHNVGVQQRGATYPFWVSEGLACVFETPPERTSTQGAGKVNQDRLKVYRKLVRDGRNLGLRRLVGEAGVPNAGVDAAYAESWATFEFLFRRHSRELQSYLASLAAREDEGKAAGSTATPGKRQRARQRQTSSSYNEIAEFEKHFQKSIDELQKEMDEYFERLK